jgi:hypothetical protein
MLPRPVTERTWSQQRLFPLLIQGEVDPCVCLKNVYGIGSRRGCNGGGSDCCDARTNAAASANEAQLGDGLLAATRP